MVPREQQEMITNDEYDFFAYSSLNCCLAINSRRIGRLSGCLTHLASGLV